MTRGPATWATVAALALINLGLATLIASVMGSANVVPTWLSVVLVTLGVAAAVAAIVLWRHYLAEARR